MNSKVEANKKAWGLLSEEHYMTFKKKFMDSNYSMNPRVLEGLGDISGKRILHLQCNTGADTMVLAKMGGIVTGVDLVPDNIRFAKQLAMDLEVDHVEFIESDIMELMEKHEGKYDIVFTSDGCIGWLPDLNQWGRTVRHFLKDDGFFFIHDGHPFLLSLDEVKIKQDILDLKYPYFSEEADEDDLIGGYASESKEAKNYFWMYTISKLINALSQAGLFIEYMKEYDRCAPGMGGTKLDEEGYSYYPAFEGKLPLVFSLKSVPR